MTRDHFSKNMQSPYFQGEHYSKNGGKIEGKIESFFKKLFKHIKKK